MGIEFTDMKTPKFHCQLNHQKYKPAAELPVLLDYWWRRLMRHTKLKENDLYRRKKRKNAKAQQFDL
jgi:hypothetical protein